MFCLNPSLSLHVPTLSNMIGHPVVTDSPEASTTSLYWYILLHTVYAVCFQQANYVFISNLNSASS